MAQRDDRLHPGGQRRRNAASAAAMHGHGRGDASRDDRAAALQACPALARIAPELEVYEGLLHKWQDTINLIAPSTRDRIWTRHFADSAQVHAAFPDVSVWADMGAGAGFPGLVLALLLKDRPGAQAHLIESDQRKAAFLRAVSRETQAPAQVHVGRIEAVLPTLLGRIEGVTARAFAPLPQLVALSREHLLISAVGAFLKGADWRSELTEAASLYSFRFEAMPSALQPEARLIAVRRQ